MRRVLKLAALLTPLVASLSVMPAFAAGNIGVTSAVQNQVEGVHGGSSSPLAAGSQVFEDEVIRTGAKSMAQLLFLDETSLQVGPQSEVTLDKFVYNPASGNGNVVFSATKGAFRFITGSQNPVNYEIKTPVASIGVRGTIADCEFLNGGIKITGQQGVVLVVVNGITYALKPGQSLFVSASKQVTGPLASDDEFFRITGASPNPLFGGLLPGEHEEVDVPDDGILRADELFPQTPPDECEPYCDDGGGEGGDETN